MSPPSAGNLVLLGQVFQRIKKFLSKFWKELFAMRTSKMFRDDAKIFLLTMGGFKKLQQVGKTIMRQLKDIFKMKCNRLTSVLLIILFYHLNLCSGIIGGFPATYHPSFVRIDTMKKVCGGTLVTPNAVVTAAHCLYNEDSDIWSLPHDIFIFKAQDLKWIIAPSVYSCESYVYHESYIADVNGGLGPYDIALIKLIGCVDIKKPTNGILKPCPADGDFHDGLAVGIGLTNTNPDTSAKSLMEVRLYKISPCAKIFKERGVEIDEEKQLCYGSRKQEKPAGTCYGDYGGPLVYKSLTHSSCLIGIASFSSYSCVNPMIPSVFTKASQFAAWIETALSTLYSMSTGPGCEILK